MRLGSLRFWPLLLCLTWPAPGQAETVYVTDRISVILRSAPGPEGVALKSLTSGAPLEVLERNGKLARVRDADRIEGWVETWALSSEAAARSQLDSLRAELATTRTALAAARAAEATARTAADAARAAAAAGVEPAPTAQAAPQSPPPPPPPAAAPTGGGFFSPAWLAISLTALIVGIVVGRIWLRESIRRRSGGMYLRV